MIIFNAHVIKYFNYKMREAWKHYRYLDEHIWWTRLFEETGIKPERLRLFEDMR